MILGLVYIIVFILFVVVRGQAGKVILLKSRLSKLVISQVLSCLVDHNLLLTNLQETLRIEKLLLCLPIDNLLDKVKPNFTSSV